MIDAKNTAGGREQGKRTSVAKVLRDSLGREFGICPKSTRNGRFHFTVTCRGSQVGFSRSGGVMADSLGENADGNAAACALLLNLPTT